MVDEVFLNTNKNSTDDHWSPLRRSHLITYHFSLFLAFTLRGRWMRSRRMRCHKTQTYIVHLYDKMITGRRPLQDYRFSLIASQRVSLKLRFGRSKPLPYLLLHLITYHLSLLTSLSPPLFGGFLQMLAVFP